MAGHGGVETPRAGSLPAPRHPDGPHVADLKSPLATCPTRLRRRPPLVGSSQRTRRSWVRQRPLRWQRPGPDLEWSKAHGAGAADPNPTGRPSRLEWSRPHGGAAWRVKTRTLRWVTPGRPRVVETSWWARRVSVKTRPLRWAAPRPDLEWSKPHGGCGVLREDTPTRGDAGRPAPPTQEPRSAEALRGSACAWLRRWRRPALECRAIPARPSARVRGPVPGRRPSGRSDAAGPP